MPITDSGDKLRRRAGTASQEQRARVCQAHPRQRPTPAGWGRLMTS